MPNYEIEVISILNDNYVFAIYQAEVNQQKSVVIVDPGEARPIINFLIQKKLSIEVILVTHHHSDHIDGLAELKQFHLQTTGLLLPVYAPELNRSQILEANIFLMPNQSLKIFGLEWKVLAMPGHTQGHLAYYCQQLQAVFSGDVLFGLGCGRLFEGSFSEAFNSLQTLKELESETLVYCTHEYTELNLKFCDSLADKGLLPRGVNRDHLEKYRFRLKTLRDVNKPSVPLLLSDELQSNPFLNVESEIEFKSLRELRNKF